jgi:hypothetical protein
LAGLSKSKQPRYSTGRSRRNISKRRRTRSAGPTPARRRGPAPILIIAGVLVLLVFCWIFGRGCGGNQEAKENDKLRAYTTSVNKLIERSSAIGVQFDNVRNSVKGLARDDIARKLSQMASDARDIQKEAGQLVVPPKAVPVQPLLVMTMDMRAGGVDKFRTGLLDVLDKKSTETAVATMSQGLTDLDLSDEAFARFRTQLDAKLKQAKSGELGYIQVANSSPYVPKKEDALVGSVNAYVAAFGGTETGNEIHGVAVTGLSTSPASQDSTSSGAAILPFSKTFTVTVAVQNQGNQTEKDIPVVVVLTDDSGGSPQQVTKKITSLKPNETTTLVFEGLKPVPGRNVASALKATAGPVANEKNQENNVKQYRFVMLPEGG